MLNYNYTQYSTQVPTKFGATIRAESQLFWTSEAPNEKTLKHLLIVSGPLTEEGRAWTEEWSFTWPDSDLKRFEQAMLHISIHVDKRASRPKLRREVYCEVYDWMRVGWIDEEAGWKAYVTFTKNGKTMTSDFADLPALRELQRALMDILNT